MNCLTRLVIAFTSLSGEPITAENSLLDELTSQGIEVEDGHFVRLPRPSFTGTMSPDVQKNALEALAEFGSPLRLLLNESPSAPFALRIADATEALEGAVIRTIDLWFVMYGKLDSLENEELFEGLLETGSGEGDLADRARELSGEELAKLGVVDVSDDEKYVYGEYTLLERVRLMGVVRSLRTRGSDSIVLASVMDPRFQKDPKYASRWRPIVRDNLGQASLGEPSPYRGFACYIKVTPLTEPAGALIAEYHAVLNEPRGWFDGRAVLKAKLPILIRDQVESFRRRLRKAAADSQ